MNPTPGILYIIDGVVKCAEREKPKARDFKSGYFGRPSVSFMIKYAKWIESCKEVLNVRSSWGKRKLVIDNRFYDINDMFQFKPSGQKCLFVPEGDKVRIVELIN